MGQYTVKREGEVAVVAMDDGKANALTFAEFDSLGQALTEVEHSNATAVVLAGRPGYFTAGLNLKLMPTMSTSDIQKIITRFGEVVLQLFVFPRPVVAAIGGHALGAGAIFAFASDVRLFAAGAFKFGLNEVAGGMFVPAFGVEVARAAAPVEHQLELVLHARVINPEQALAMRLAEAVVPPEALLTTALERATMLGQLSGDAYARTKVTLRGPAADRARSCLTAEVAGLGQALEANR